MTATPSVDRAASRLVAALEHAWTAIRTQHPDVPQVVVVVASGSDPRSKRLNLGHFAAARWQLTDQPTDRAEVLVSGEGLQRGPVDVLGTLLHEAAHGLAHARKISDTSRQGRYHCEGHGAWVVQAEDAPGKGSGAGLTLATTGRVCLGVDPSAVFLGVFSAPPACLGDLIGARLRASSQCCPRSGWWAPSLSEHQGGDGEHAPHRVPGHHRCRQPQGAARRGRRGSAGPPPWRHHGGDHPTWVWAAGTLGPAVGIIQWFGIEGTGSYAAGLARWLQARGHQVVEVNRPNRQTRRRQGKSDPIDAEAAARAALAGHGLVWPKTADGTVEMLRVLRMARRSAMKARTQTAQQLDSLVVTAPDRLRAQLRRLSLEQLVPVAAGLRPGELVGPLAATKLALRTLARRHQSLSAELARLDHQIAKLTATTAPRLLARGGVGPQVATALLVAAGDNPARLRSDAAFAMLCGAAPIPASSGKVIRHRLNRGGDRQANNALWTIAVCRMSYDPRTIAYVQRRTQEGKSKLEIIRCLKRYIAREVHRDLQAALLT